MTREELPTRLRGMAEMLDSPQIEGHLVLPTILRVMHGAADEIESLVAENTQLEFEFEHLRNKSVKKSVFATHTEAFRMSDIIRFEKCTRLNGKFALVLWLHSQEDVVYIDGNSEAINGYFEELCRNMED